MTDEVLKVWLKNGFFERASFHIRFFVGDSLKQSGFFSYELEDKLKI
jgi:hypothetical protein